MEWVETTGKTIEEAQERALDQLGVVADEAEFEVLSDVKTGIFGRLKTEARVRARVRPTQPRGRGDRRPRRRGAAGETSATPETEDRPAPKPRQNDRRPSESRSSESRSHESRSGESRSNDQRRKERPATTVPQEGRNPKKERATMRDDDRREHDGPEVETTAVASAAEEFLTGLAGAFGLTVTTTVSTEGDDIAVNLEGQNVGLLVGPKGATLAAIQDVARVASQRKLGDHRTHLRLDIGGYRERRRVALERFTNDVASEVLSSGTARSLEPMSSADRKVVHDTVMTIDGVTSRSIGDDPNRRVVIEVGA